jgi:hypothetical protein
LGGALLGLEAEGARWQRLSEYAALMTMLLGLLAVLGYAYGVESLYRVYLYTSMALHTALLFVALGLGTLAARCDRGLVATITSAYDGAIMARHVLPLAITLPFILGGSALRGSMPDGMMRRLGWPRSPCLTS